MSVNPSKFGILGFGSLAARSITDFEIDGAVIPAITEEIEYHNLGVPRDASDTSYTLDLAGTIADLRAKLERIRSSGLFHGNKVGCLTRFAIPRLEYMLRLGSGPKDLLRTYTATIRDMACRYLSLSHNASADFIHVARDSRRTELARPGEGNKLPGSSEDPRFHHLSITSSPFSNSREGIEIPEYKPEKGAGLGP